MRVKGGIKARRRHNRLLKQVKGFVSGRRRIFRQAAETLRRALVYAYRDRRRRKRDFRSLWITRIAAAAQINGISYSRMVHGLKRAGCELNRKMLAELAVHDPAAFKTLAQMAQSNLA